MFELRVIKTNIEPKQTAKCSLSGATCLTVADGTSNTNSNSTVTAAVSSLSLRQRQRQRQRRSHSQCSSSSTSSAPLWQMLCSIVLLLQLLLQLTHGVFAEIAPSHYIEDMLQNHYRPRHSAMLLPVAGRSGNTRKRIHVLAGTGGGISRPVAATVTERRIIIGSGGGKKRPSLNVSMTNEKRRCTAQRYGALAKAYDDVEDLEVGVPANIAFERRQRKRFQLHLNATRPLTITFSQRLARKIYFNETMNLSRQLEWNKGHQIVFPCALHGQYDIFVLADQRGSLKIEANLGHPNASWPLLNRTQHVNVRSRSHFRKLQMTVKWDKSHFDFHAVQYCLVVRNSAPATPSIGHNFCMAVEEYISGISARRGFGCQAGHFMDSIWSRAAERMRKIDPHHTNIFCTGNRTQQVIRGLTPNHTYYTEVFGVHTKRQNLTFHLASAVFHFKRRHPAVLQPNALALVKLNGLHGAHVYSYKVPAVPLPPQALQDSPDPPTTIYQHNSQTDLQLRYLIIPCDGSEVNATVQWQKFQRDTVPNIYLPTYVRVPAVQAGQRCLIRFRPSNEDEQLRANKVGLAVTTRGIFTDLPELPQNITVFEVVTRCMSSTVAWHTAPEKRKMSYCVITLHVPHRNRSAIDYTDYCLDFGKRILQNPLFHSMKCTGMDSHPPFETFTILNLSPGGNYLVYVTAKLNDGQSLPYQSLHIRTPFQCYNELADSDSDSMEQTSFY